MGEKLTKKTAQNALNYYQGILTTLKRVDGRFRRKSELRTQARLQRAWKKQMEWIIKNMEKLSQFDAQEEKTVILLNKKATDPEIARLVNDLPYDEAVVASVSVSAKASYVKGGRKTFQQFNLAKVGMSFSLVNKGAVSYIKDLKTLHLSNKKGSITRTTKTRLIKILADAAETGKSYQETSKLIQLQAKAGVFSQARGEMIAVREVGLAYGQGNLAPIKEYEKEYGAIIQKSWITSGDGKVTPECNANLLMGWIDLDKNFENTGVQEVAPRSDHPRCRCDTGYREVDEDGKPV